MNNISKDIQDRFWGKVQFKENGCWEWIASKSNTGYGRFRLNGKLHLPHRLVYQWVNGPIPNSLLVCHKCDNPSCVNPSHLFKGTKSQNMLDASRKNRIFRGGRPEKRIGNTNGQTKIKDCEIKQVKDLYEYGFTGTEIAKMFEISHSQIYKILKGGSRH